MDYQTQYQEYKALADAALNTYFADTTVSYHRLLEAMHYSLTAGGKRLRPVLVLAFCAACGGDVRAALPVACAVEMVHTYSLIHDDLPCMDNDDLRRGKPTNHVVYGECTATLAGDALQAEAFHTILSTELPADVRAECARLLAEAAGENGICGGQQLDMEGEGKVLTKEELMDINDRKTSAMIHAACLMGVTCGGGSARPRRSMPRRLVWRFRSAMTCSMSSVRRRNSANPSARMRARGRTPSWRSMVWSAAAPMCTSCPSKRQQPWTVCLRTAHFCSSSPARWQIGKTESIKTQDFR